MYCHQCGNQLNENARFCSKCGAAVKSNVLPKSTKILIAALIMSGLFLAGTTLYFLDGVFQNREKTAEQVDVTEEEIDLTKLANDKPELEKEKTVIIKESMPKVFTILTRDGQGSGFLYKKGGYIITNAHVVAGYTDVVVRNSTGKDSAANVIGISDEFDVALIKASRYEKAQPLAIEEQESVIGTEVIAIGTPQGLENSASIGYLTGIGRNIDYGFTYKNVYQIDAQIDQGSSGGPLLDAKTGKVIGINSLLYRNNASFGFSIPMYSVKNLVDSWVEFPMSEQEIASLFDVYKDNEHYDYDPESSGYYDEYFDYYEDNYDDYYFENDGLEEFILYFRDFYEMALFYEDFYWVEDMLYPSSEAYDELQKYIASIVGKEMYFDFINHEVLNIEIYDQYALVTVLEQFDYSSPVENKYYEQIKTYTVVIDEDGYYQITKIDIHE